MLEELFKLRLSESFTQSFSCSLALGTYPQIKKYVSYTIFSMYTWVQKMTVSYDWRVIFQKNSFFINRKNCLENRLLLKAVMIFEHDYLSKYVS